MGAGFSIGRIDDEWAPLNSRAIPACPPGIAYGYWVA